MKPRRISVAAFGLHELPAASAVFFVLLLASRSRADQPELPQILDSRMQITCFAADPEIVTPIGIACDRAGRVFVLESHTHLPPRDYVGPKFDRVKVLRDTDGDGRADDIRVFADSIYQGMNLAFSPDDTLHVVTSKQVIALPDADGDGVCDERERRVLVRLETKQDYAHSQLLGLTFSHDGWMFVSRGNVAGFAYTWIGSDGRRIDGYGEGGDIVRCRADGSQVERHAQGFWNPFDLRFDCHGRLLCVDNDPDSRGPNRLLHITRGGEYGFRALYGPSGLHPYDAWEGELPGTLPMIAGVGEAPSAVLDLSFAALPNEYRGAIAVTVWGEHNVSLVRTEPRGVSLAGKAEPWIIGGNEFRPVGLAASPDGSLYITDWVLKDYPNHGRGVVWRLSAKPGVPTLAPFDPHAKPQSDDAVTRVKSIEDGPFANDAKSSLRDDISPERILAALQDDDPFLRSAAVFHLSRAETADRLRQMWNAESPHARCGVLLAMKRQNSALPCDVISAALRDADEDVRIAALMWIGDEVLRMFSSDVDLAVADEAVSPRLFEVWLATKQILASEVEHAYARRERGFNITRDVPAELLRSIVLDERRAPAMRALALPRLVDEIDEEVRAALLRWSVEVSGPLQREAIRTLARDASTEAGSALRAVALDEQRPAEIRAEALAALSHQPQQLTAELLPLLNEEDETIARQAARALRMIAAGAGMPAMLSQAADATRSAAVKEILQFALGVPSAPRPATPDDWQRELATGGEPAAGERLFHSAGVTCIQCHRVHNRGGRIGPDLSVIGRTASRAKLIHSIVQPGDDIAPQFQGWMVVTTDGRIITGLQGHLRSGGAVSIIDTEGRQRNISGDQVEEFTAMKKSLMPDNLARSMPIADLRDLVAWLETLR